MTLSDLADLGSVVAALAVVLTLPVLIISIRQNTRAQRAVVVDSLAKGIADINVPLTQDASIGAALQATAQDWHKATRDQRIKAHYFYYSLFKLHENAWYQMRAGILEPQVWEGWETNLRLFYHQPGIQQVWWSARKGSYSKEFRDHLAATVPVEMGSLREIFGPPPAS